MVVATALSSAVASILCGFFGNLPFGLAPGTGLSVYLTYGLYMTGAMTKEQAMVACVISGRSMCRPRRPHGPRSHATVPLWVYVGRRGADGPAGPDRRRQHRD